MIKKHVESNMSTKAAKQSELVLRSAYGTALPIDKNTGFYKFKSSANGVLEFRISRLVKDYPSFGIATQLSAFVNAYVEFSKLWLAAHGYIPKIVFCDGYVPFGQTSAYDNQAQLRSQIMADFICPTNTGPMTNWRGIKRQLIDPASQVISDFAKHE